MNDHLITYAQALQIIEERVPSLAPQTVNWRDALGMTLAEDLSAREDYPPFDNSAVDGYALVAEDTLLASEAMPVALQVQEEVYAGKHTPRMPLHPGYATQIMTGAPVPEGADAVIMVEHTERDEDRVRLYRPAAPGENIRSQGEELRAGEKLLFHGFPIGSVEQGILAQQGILQVKAVPKPTVAVLCTGDELVEPEATPTGGQIRNTNLYTLLAELKTFGCETRSLGIGSDDREILREKVRQGIDSADVLLTSGGVSAGEKDYLPALLREMGMEAYFHKVAVKPGKPLLFGRIDHTFVFGLPGNVVSTLCSYHLFVKPALRRLAGWENWRNPVWYVRVGEALRNPGDRANFIRAALRHAPDGLPIAFPTGKQGSGMLTSMRRADGFIRIPADLDAVAEFDVLEFIPIQPT